MDEKTPKILKIYDLVIGARPLTGVSSISPAGTVSAFDSPRSDQPREPIKLTSQYPEPKILKPLNHPTILIGTISLPLYHDGNYNASSTIQCSCFQFNDGSATICCDILNCHPQIIGKNVRICAWNFIPLKVRCNLSGFLEIIRWEFLECSSNLTAFSLAFGSTSECKDNSKAKYSIFGVLDSISPVSVIPCSTGSRSDSRNICGFLVKILVCECILCRSKTIAMALRDLSEENCKNHCFMKSLTVYFCGLASSWHPVISRLIGSGISLSGLKKKRVYIGKEDYELMYVTTENALLQLPEIAKKCISNKKTELRGLGEVGSYAGTVTGVYMQGTVVELDQELLLLLTDQQLNVPHSLRVGAIVSVRNVHFVRAKFSWTKILVLGACFVTCICVESFSPLETGCHRKSCFQNLLRKFVDSLAFSARLWVLLMITCFKKKFAGILSENDILGSKHTAGLAQTYATSHLPASAYPMRQHGVFAEYCRHGSCAFGKEEDYSILKLVVPISCFRNHFENRWMKMLLDWKNDFDIMGTIQQRNDLSCCGRSYAKLIQKIFQSEDTGVVLLGNLKVSLSSGRLQLVDATGSIDVVIPDIPSTWDFNRVYEAMDFTVVMQGVSNSLDNIELVPSEKFTCKSIFQSVPLRRETKLSLFLYYHFGDKKSRIYPSPSENCKGSFQEFVSGKFHLLWLKHKFPLLHKCLGDQFISIRSSAFTEAVILPWDLILTEKDEIAYLTGLPLDEQRNFKKYQKHVGLKRCKTDKASSEAMESELCDAAMLECSSLKDSYCSDYCTERKHCNLSYPLKFPCLISGRSLKCPCRGLVHCTDEEAVSSSGCKPVGRGVFLEFDSESLYKYQRLRIGAYYIVKHHGNDGLCTANHNNNVTGGAVLVTSETCLWSLSFSSDVVLRNSDSSSRSKFPNSFVSNHDIMPDASQQFDIPPLRFNPVSPESGSDINLCVPADIVSYLKIDTDVSEGGLMKSSISLEKETDIYNGGGGILTTPVLISGTFHSGLHLPEGNLLSFHGHIVAIHDSDGASFLAHLRNESSLNVHQPMFSQGTSIICIHVLVDQHMAMIVGALGKHAYPTGFGPGVDATFHRILVLGGQNQYMLIPASFIVINSANIVGYRCIDESDSVSDPLVAQCATSLGTFPTTLISEITHSIEPLQLHCRIVGLYVLVLQKNKKAGYNSTTVQACSSVVDIPLAGFILDDGSSSCCCWTNYERAANMLRLPTEAIAQEACARNSWISEIPVRRKANGSTIGHLNKILKQHGRVVVKNYGSLFDSSCLDLTFAGDPDEVICNSDENLLRCLVMNACFSTLWTVVGSLMDSTAIHRLEKQLSELEMTILPLRNIWATGVFHCDPLTESRFIIEGLVNS